MALPMYPTALSIPEGRVKKMHERVRLAAWRSAAQRDAAVQSVTKPEIKQHRE